MNSMDDVVALVTHLCSQDADELKRAEKLLKSVETTAGFHAALQDVYFRVDLPTQVRWMAARTLRAGIERMWRRPTKQAFGADEKAQIRSRALNMLTESDRMLLAQVGAIISKIARLDFPSDWPTVLTDLFALVQSEDPEVRQRALFALHHVIKALVSQKIGLGRRHFEQIAPNLLDACVTLFEASSGQYDPAALYTTLYALKCVRKLLAFGLRQLDPVADRFLSNVAVYLNMYYVNQQEKHVTNLGKLVLDLVEYHGLKWLTYAGTGAVVTWYAEAVLAKSDAIPPSVLIQALLVLKNLVRFASRFTLENGQLHPSTPEEAVAQYNALQTIATPTLLLNLLNALATYYLRYTADDQQSIASDPHDWIIEEDNDHWEYRIRPCASRVVMELANNYTDLIVPALGQLAQSMTALTMDTATMLAVMNALGPNAEKLSSAVSYVDFFQQFLLPWARQVPATDPLAPLVHRTVAASIGWFMGGSVPKASRPVLYESLAVHFLASPHPIVQFAAVEALRCSIDDWDFQVAGFLPYLNTLMVQLLTLLGAVDQFELKVKVINCLSVIIERLDKNMAPYAPALAAHIPALWEQADEEHLFQASLLVLLQKLTIALRNESVHLHAICVPLIQVACVADLPSAVYLMEDGLVLWHTLLQFHAPPPPAPPAVVAGVEVPAAGSRLGDLGHLLPLVPALLETGTEALRTALKIVQSYLLLDAETTVTAIGAGVMARLHALLGGLAPTTPSSSGSSTTPSVAVVRPQVNAFITRVLDMFLATAPAASLPLLVQSQILTRLVRGVATKHDHTLALVAFVGVLARVALLVTPTEFAAQCGADFPALIGNWYALWDNIGQPPHRKLAALALTRLAPCTLGQLPVLAAIWTEILHEVHESNGGDALIYWQLETTGDEDMDVECGEATRRRDLMRRDPVHTVPMVAFIREAIAELGTGLGGMPNLTARLDPEVIAALEPMLK
ncbi:hypothetical protein GGF32_000654 [Allomyces javanicus]|nr:hypothetical protein GGF32_000654 [Allomyces javanicus]